jgi:hypothetical protein
LCEGSGGEFSQRIQRLGPASWWVEEAAVVSVTRICRGSNEGRTGSSITTVPCCLTGNSGLYTYAQRERDVGGQGICLAGAQDEDAETRIVRVDSLPLHFLKHDSQRRRSWWGWRWRRRRWWRRRGQGVQDGWDEQADQAHQYHHGWAPASIQSRALYAALLKAQILSSEP